MFLHHHFIISKNPPRLRLLTHFLTFCFRHYGKLLHHLHFTAAQSDVRCLIKKNINIEDVCPALHFPVFSAAHLPSVKKIGRTVLEIFEEQTDRWRLTAL